MDCLIYYIYNRFKCFNKLPGKIFLLFPKQLPNGVPVQTLLQSNQGGLGAQTIYNNPQPQGLFPAQGSVHIENPKVVNVNFGPHVIQQDGGGHILQVGSFFVTF